jgi:membrane protein DedA with SNARE-associated domain
MSVVGTLIAEAGQVIDSVGYAGLALVMLVENVLPPVPSEVVLPLVGLQVSAGHLAYWAAVLASTVGSVLGAWALYGIGRAGGRTLALRLPRVVGVTPERLDRTERWFARRGDAIVVLARLVPGLRSAVSVPAGALRMPVARFLTLTAVGSAVWNAALIWVGAALAADWQAVAGAVSAASTWALASATGGVMLFVMVFVMVRRIRTARIAR